MKEKYMMENIVCSSSATAIAEMMTLPICAIKTNYQTNIDSTIGGSISNIYRNRGIWGFYSASLPSIAAQVFSTAGKYSLYRIGTNNNIPTVISGILAGVTVSIVTHPLDFIRVSLQRGEIITFNKNVAIFYRGYSKSLMKVIVGSSVFLPIYDFSKRIVKEKQGIDSPFIASTISGIISTTVLQPFDYIKIRNIAGLPWYQGLNPVKYLRGYTLNLLRVVPHFIITMSLTEKFSSILSLKNDDLNKIRD